MARAALLTRKACRECTALARPTKCTARSSPSGPCTGLDARAAGGGCCCSPPPVDACFCLLVLGEAPCRSMKLAPSLASFLSINEFIHLIFPSFGVTVMQPHSRLRFPFMSTVSPSALPLFHTHTFTERERKRERENDTSIPSLLSSPSPVPCEPVQVHHPVAADRVHRRAEPDVGHARHAAERRVAGSPPGHLLRPRGPRCHRFRLRQMPGMCRAPRSLTDALCLKRGGL